MYRDIKIQMGLLVKRVANLHCDRCNSKVISVEFFSRNSKITLHQYNNILL